MSHVPKLILICFLLCCQACATAHLWESTNPNERIWIDATKTTEADLRKRNVEYEVYQDARGSGYLVKKTSRQKMRDYQLRMLATPFTVVLDAAATVVVVGVYMFMNDPAGTCSLIEAMSDGSSSHQGHGGGGPPPRSTPPPRRP
jgi:hypothetical protein